MPNQRMGCQLMTQSRTVTGQLRPTSDSYASGSRAIAEKQNEKVEKPDTNCGHRCSHVGPSGRPQNLLNSDYLRIPPDDSLAYQQFLCPWGLMKRLRAYQPLAIVGAS